MAYEPVPDNISDKFARSLSNIDTDELRLTSLPASDSSNSKKVTFADFPDEDSEIPKLQPAAAGDMEQLRRLNELRQALGRHIITERGISYLTPVNKNRISVENVFKPDISAAFGKDLPRKDAALFNDRPGEVSPRDTPRLCRDISEIRGRSGNFFSPREERVPKEFSLTKYKPHKDHNRQAKSSGVDIVLPSSSLPQRRLRRTSMTIGPRIKDLLDSFTKYADVTEDMDGVPPTRETRRKRRNHENVLVGIPKVIGDDQKRDILKWLEKGDKAARRK